MTSKFLTNLMLFKEQFGYLVKILVSLDFSIVKSRSYLEKLQTFTSFLGFLGQLCRIFYFLDYLGYFRRSGYPEKACKKSLRNLVFVTCDNFHFTLYL